MLVISGPHSYLRGSVKTLDGPAISRAPTRAGQGSATCVRTALDASSLLILTSDCTLREYTVSDTVEEPSQTLSFTRSRGEQKPAGRSFGLSAVDRDASTAVAMCIGEGGGDWGPLTLYALMRNGDIVAMCPFLPKKACVRSLSAPSSPVA